MRAKNFAAGERVIVNIDGSPYEGNIGRRLDETGKRWSILLDDGMLHDANVIDVRRHRVMYVDPTPEEIAERAAEIRAEWPEQLTRARWADIREQPVQPEPVKLWQKTRNGGLAE